MIRVRPKMVMSVHNYIYLCDKEKIVVRYITSSLIMISLAFWVPICLGALQGIYVLMCLDCLVGSLVKF